MAKRHQLGDRFSLNDKGEREDLKWFFLKCLVNLILVMFGCGKRISSDLLWKCSLEQSRGRRHLQYREQRERKKKHSQRPEQLSLPCGTCLDFFVFLLLRHDDTAMFSP